VINFIVLATMTVRAQSHQIIRFVGTQMAAINEMVNLQIRP
jgi:hypothetical protein